MKAELVELCVLPKLMQSHLGEQLLIIKEPSQIIEWAFMKVSVLEKALNSRTYCSGHLACDGYTEEQHFFQFIPGPMIVHESTHGLSFMNFARLSSVSCSSIWDGIL